MLKFVDLKKETPQKRDTKTRSEDFKEIYDEYINAKAKEQSSRCSQCGVPFCQIHCPLSNNIPDWLKLSAEGRLQEAYEVSQSTNNMPEICGRICPQDRLCEGNCVKQLVVKGLDLDIAEGEFVTMLGPSGSGKTTCLMMLAGFETPTNGQIYLDNKVISDIPPHKRGIGMVFQNYALFPHMTVYENLAFPLRVRKIPKDEADKKVDKALSMVSLQGFEARMPMQLSGGQQQRVAVARSLVFDPQLVLMDEPLGALDKNLRESMQYEIKHIHESIGVTVVYVTHDQTEALTMSNRIAVFNDGKVQQLSSPDELYERPVNSFVAEFIGENNTFAGEVSDVSGDKCKVKLNSGTEILANPIVIKAKGEKTTVSLRPERALIDPETKMDNNHKGKIEEVIYHGDHTRLRLDLLGNKQFILKVPNSSNRIDIQEGKEINIGWNSVDCRALDPK